MLSASSFAGGVRTPNSFSAFSYLAANTAGLFTFRYFFWHVASLISEPAKLNVSDAWTRTSGLRLRLRWLWLCFRFFFLSLRLLEWLWDRRRESWCPPEPWCFAEPWFPCPRELFLRLLWERGIGFEKKVKKVFFYYLALEKKNGARRRTMCCVF